jgi:hypothetical protein
MLIGYSCGGKVALPGIQKSIFLNAAFITPNVDVQPVGIIVIVLLADLHYPVLLLPEAINR